MQTTQKDSHHTQVHPKIGKKELKLNKMGRMLTIKTLGWNFGLYTQGMTVEQEGMPYYNVVGPLHAMLNLRAKAAKHWKDTLIIDWNIFKGINQPHSSLLWCAPSSTLGWQIISYC